jgi:DNA repair protein RadC
LERLYHYGPGALSTQETLSALIGGQHQIEIAAELIVRFRSATGIAKASIHDLTKVPHLGRAGAARLKAALELGRRLALDTVSDRPQIRSPADAANLLMLEMRGLDKEHLRLVLLDTKNRVLAIPTLYIGNVNTSIIRVGELIREALRYNAPGMIVVHNHPSGCPDPSPEDIRVTERIRQACQLMDIDLLDHLIIGDNRFVSLKERRLGFS